MVASICSRIDSILPLSIAESAHSGSQEPRSRSIGSFFLYLCKQEVSSDDFDTHIHLFTLGDCDEPITSYLLYARFRDKAWLSAGLISERVIARRLGVFSVVGSSIELRTLVFQLIPPVTTYGHHSLGSMYSVRPLLATSILSGHSCHNHPSGFLILGSHTSTRVPPSSSSSRLRTGRNHSMNDSGMGVVLSRASAYSRAKSRSRKSLTKVFEVYLCRDCRCHVFRAGCFSARLSNLLPRPTACAASERLITRIQVAVDRTACSACVKSLGENAKLSRTFW